VQTTDTDATGQALQTTSVIAVMLGGFPAFILTGKEGDMIVRKRPHRFGNEVRHQIGLRRCVGGLAAMLGAALVPVVVSAAECPARREPSIPPPESIATPDKPIAKGFNIDTYKRQLTEYHDDEGRYKKDIAAVMDAATAYVLGRAKEARRPAVVLDIDETSLSNWDNLKADDFGFIAGGTCSLQEKMPCGFDDWIDQAKAPAIEPTLKFFNSLRAKDVAVNIAVFFITGRRENQRQATLWNLDRMGFNGWAGLVTRPDNDRRDSIVPFKSGERDKVAERYTILANIGDQDSDLEDVKGKSAECSFKLPNPYYFLR
jgi:HAD superfamily, subfamily IIIB (Acid phosphatase)